jgi:hypothetical protein
MKKIRLLTLLLLIATTAQSQTKVYVNYVTHNEDNYDQYVINQPFYVSARTMLHQFATDCKMKGAKWNMGNDFKMLDAVAAHDIPPVTANTNGLNLLKWFQDSMDVELDAHAHAQSGNPSLADVAYKHTLLGVVPSSVVSGYLLSEADGNNNWWFDYENPVQSNLNQNYFYHPEILWGAATPGHTNDPLYYGIWKPTDTLNYFTHSASNRLINYGNGCRIKITDTTTVDEVLVAVDSVINGIQNGDYPATGFYQISLFIEEYLFWDSLITPPANYTFSGDFLARINEITDSINVRVNQNTMEWMHIEDIVDEWKTTYNAVPFYVSCDQQSVLAVEEEQLSSNSVSIYPNPATDVLHILPEQNMKDYDLFVYNMEGRLVYEEGGVTGKASISTKGFRKGIYVIRLATANSNVTSKLIVK